MSKIQEGVYKCSLSIERERRDFNLATNLYLIHDTG